MNYRSVTLETDRGDVECRYYDAPGARCAAVWVGGAGGSWDTPARGLYPRLCEELAVDGIASLRVRFRHATVLEEAVFDVLAGIAHLERTGIGAFGLVGHSFGGAVVIRAAAASAAVRTVVALATQSYGADAARFLPPGCSILLVHGTADSVLPPSSSEYVHRLAREPKRLVLYEGAEHGLEEVADDVAELVRSWVVETLRDARRARES